jgi:GR25 family glycosyltransferase involved in LPS biosynthesis
MWIEKESNSFHRFYFFFKNIRTIMEDTFPANEPVSFSSLSFEVNNDPEEEIIITHVEEEEEETSQSPVSVPSISSNGISSNGISSNVQRLYDMNVLKRSIPQTKLPEPPMTDRKVSFQIDESQTKKIAPNTILPVYVLYLEKEVEKKQKMAQHLESMKVNPIWFSGIDGSKLMFQSPSHKQILPIYPGSTGCCLSHIQLWNHIYQTCSEEYAIILEDDSIIMPNFNDRVIEWIEQLPRNWNFFFLGMFGPFGSTVRRGCVKLHSVDKMGVNTGLYGYVIRKQQIPQIIQTLRGIDLRYPYLDRLTQKIFHLLPSYGLIPPFQLVQHPKILPSTRVRMDQQAAKQTNVSLFIPFQIPTLSPIRPQSAPVTMSATESHTLTNTNISDTTESKVDTTESKVDTTTHSESAINKNPTSILKPSSAPIPQVSMNQVPTVGQRQQPPLGRVTMPTRHMNRMQQYAPNPVIRPGTPLLNPPMMPLFQWDHRMKQGKVYSQGNTVPKNSHTWSYLNRMNHSGPSPTI